MEDTAAGVTYRYNYDSIGRLIGTNQTGGAADLRAAYGYDNESRLKSIQYSIPGVVDSAIETFYYNTSTTDSISDGALTSMALFSNEWIYYRYDSLSRLKERDVGGILTEHETYLAGTNDCTTTTLPETFYTTAKGSSTKLSGFKYAYNEVGNVTQITNLLDNSYWKFAYDKMGQMQYATDYAADGTARGRYKYYYDNAGNLTSWKIQDGSATVTQEEHTYTYGDSNWKDLLTAFDGQTITYDGSGNPLSYYNGQRYTMTWRNGRELNTATVGGKTYSYEYDVNGLRTRKTNSDGGYTQYYIVDGLTVAEQRFTSTGAEKYTLRYLFDENNSPVGFGIQYPSETTWTNYYFAKNLQGDVIALYLWNGTSTGTLVATYKYDLWGKPIGIYNASGVTISQTAANVAAYNPFRYRGYLYDADTGFYYLKTRYYDPELGRFINGDDMAYLGTDESALSYNLYAYCKNNPIMLSDPNGHAPEWWQWAISGAMVVAGAALVATGVGGVAGGALICAGANSIVGSYVSESSGGSSVAGWAGGMVSGAVCGISAGLAGNLLVQASGSAGAACLGNLAASGAVAFGSGAVGSAIGQGVSAVIDGKKLSKKEVVFSSITTGAVNCLSGIGSGMGTAIQSMPIISTTSTTLANSLTAAWSLVSESVCDFLGSISNLLPW